MKNLLTKNKQWLFPPLIVLPFLFLIFYLLGGGQGTDQTLSGKEADGANYQLPEADRQIGILDKKEAYQRQEDWKEEQQVQWDVDTITVLQQVHLSDDLGEEDTQALIARHMKKQEESVRAALEQPTTIKDNKSTIELTVLKQARVQRDKTSSTRPGIDPKSTNNTIKEKSVASSFEAMESLINSHETLAREKDSLQLQLQQMQAARTEKNSNPERQTIKAKVAVKPNQSTSMNQQAIMVTIMDDCTVRSGNRVLMRLEKDIQVENQLVKAGSLIYGLCKTENERLQLQVSSIPVRGSFLPVDLSAYDTDGIRGLYVPDHAARKVYQDVAGDINPSMLLTPEGQPLSYMGLNVAGDMAQTMIKTVREKKVHLRKNTLVILRNN
nr:conjugative transposon protein TraM [uncultured Carboxylicivirga sp.]